MKSFMLATVASLALSLPAMAQSDMQPAPRTEMGSHSQQAPGTYSRDVSRHRGAATTGAGSSEDRMAAPSGDLGPTNGMTGPNNGIENNPAANNGH